MDDLFTKISLSIEALQLSLGNLKKNKQKNISQNSHSGIG